MPNGASRRLKRGVFVTLLAGPELRGCIGHVAADRPLGDVVRDMTVAAARDDPRFPPVAPDELPGLSLEISVLGAPAALVPVDPARVAIGRDGVIVRRGRSVGVLLPQVAPEQRLDAETFLAAACRKAGLAAGAWREPGTEVFTFSADVLRETTEGGGEGENV